VVGFAAKKTAKDGGTPQTRLATTIARSKPETKACWAAVVSAWV
jgi:hypothetical protein